MIIVIEGTLKLIFMLYVIIYIIKKQLHDETRFQHFFPEIWVYWNQPFSLVFVIGKRGGTRLFSNAAYRNGVSTNCFEISSNNRTFCIVYLCTVKIWLFIIFYDYFNITHSLQNDYFNKAKITNECYYTIQPHPFKA